MIGLHMFDFMIYLEPRPHIFDKSGNFPYNLFFLKDWEIYY